MKRYLAGFLCLVLAPHIWAQASFNLQAEKQSQLLVTRRKNKWYRPPWNYSNVIAWLYFHHQQQKTLKRETSLSVQLEKVHCLQTMESTLLF